ncbi:hypothetical protein AB0D08_40450 [Kitasatospora sp. NPDC048540]|uniref:hypothetical protein n=1 Tax=Kitasatospora sp. NPDC048540 TaxID=3155634 RepID=UPI0033E06F21
MWAAQYRLFREWGGVPHTMRRDPSGTDVPASPWDEGDDWSTYRTQAELGSTTVEFLREGITEPALLTTARRHPAAACPPGRLFTSPDDLATALHRWPEDFPSPWAPDRTAHRTTERAALLTGPSSTRPLLQPPPGSRLLPVRPDCAGYVRAAGNDYLVGEWGARRTLTVEVTDAEVVIRSGGYHAGGFHTRIYAHPWAQKMQLTVPLRHEVVEHHRGVRKEANGP